jgi:hypothetical protein
MSQDQTDFTGASPEVMYDAVFSTVGDWAAARNVVTSDPNGNPGEYLASAKLPTVPFMRLTREIGVVPVEDTEVRPMTIDRQKKVASWVGKVTTPFDLIQRAEGFESPDFVYYAGQNRASKNLEAGTERAITRGKSGMAAVRRQYSTTQDHHIIAKTRAESATLGMRQLKDGLGFTPEARIAVTEILQELANGLAANLDDLFIGGDSEARIAGNSILGVSLGIDKGVIDPSTQTRLIYAAIGYIKKQERLWDRKLRSIHDFAAEKGFTVGQPKNKVA